MKIYRCAFNDASLGLVLTWHANKRSAEHELRRRQSERDEPTGVEMIEAMEIPTDKRGLISWLNRHFDVDNG